MGLILLILLVLIVVGGLPTWSYWGPNRPNGYGYGPSLIGLILLVLVIVWLFGGVHLGRL